MSVEPKDAIIAAPSLPKGGGAIQSIGKGWGAVGVTGASSFSIPLPVTPGRGFAPNLSLTYDSQGGRSVFGQGWQLDLPCIARRTGKGTPRYDDTDDFVSPSGDVLVPERLATGVVVSRKETAFRGYGLGAAYDVVVYRPRVDGAGHRYESWRRDDAWFWLVHLPDGTLQVFGKRARTEAPGDGGMARIAQWWLDECVSATGERMLFEYRKENANGLSEDDLRRDHATATYLANIRYGNAKASLQPSLMSNVASGGYLFELIFDYGERPLDLEPVTGPPTYVSWQRRADPYASFQFGFEVRVLRLCHQVIMTHRISELGSSSITTGRLVFEYESTPFVSLLTTLHVVAHDENDISRFMPPMSFSYGSFAPPEAAKWSTIDVLPQLQESSRYQLVDLLGEGLPGVLHRARGGWYYREPLRGSDANDVIYGDWGLLPDVPSGSDTTAIAQALTDMTGDGKLDWVVASPGLAGWFSLSPDGQWSGFMPFAAFPPEFADPHGQIADLSGEGLADFAMIGTSSVRWYGNARQGGYSPPVDVLHELGECLPGWPDDRGVLVAFSDIFGSGQQHLLRITHDAVDVWPQLGRGHFGARMRFSTLPFDATTFDAGRIRLADLDGSGAIDVIYLEADHAVILMNQSGNGLAAPVSLAWPDGVRYDMLCDVSAADLQGLGAASLVLSRPMTSPRHWRCDFVGHQRPAMLVGTDNHMGGVTAVTYRSSAQEWLDEKAERRAADLPAASGLPFPVQVVVRQEQLDEITGQRLAQRFGYRQGYYDGREREFRGFGLVSQIDVDEGSAADGDDVPPTLVKTWFHVGRGVHALDGTNASDMAEVRLGPTLYATFDAQNGRDVVADTWADIDRDAMDRALSGSVLRTEVFGLDDPASPPYSIAENRFLVRLVLASGPGSGHAVVMPLPLETLMYRYDRMPTDPQVTHQIGLRWDLTGAPTHAVTVHYARRRGESPFPPDDEFPRRWWLDARDDAQFAWYLTETLGQWIHLMDDPAWWRLSLPYRSRGNAMVLPEGALVSGDVDYEHFIADDGPISDATERTLSALAVQRYQGAMDGQATFAALADATESAEFDSAALMAYEGVVAPDELDDLLIDAGYVSMAVVLPDSAETVWAARRHYTTYEPLDHFYRVTAYQPTLGLGITRAEYDSHWLHVTRVTAPDGCSTETSYDYRRMLPIRSVDANGTVCEVRYDAFGRVLATAFRGKERGKAVGFGPIEAYDRTIDTPDDALAAPHEAIQNVATVSFYAPFAWMGEGGGQRRPPHALTLTADRYPGDAEGQVRRSIVDSDGFGRILQTKQYVEPGDAYVVTEDGQLEMADGHPVVAHAAARWRVSERVEYNNKGWVLRVYRPYFASSHRYIRDDAFRDFGYCDRQFYDPLGRPTVTLTAAGWMRRETYWPWYTISEDENDTEDEVRASRDTPAPSQSSQEKNRP